MLANDQIDALVRSWIVEILRSHVPLVAVAVRQRAKFEGWLKFELAAYAALKGASDVTVETSLGNEAGTRSDVTFLFQGSRYDIELKTCNTNWRMEGIRNLTRPITKNVSGIVIDAKKLQQCPGDGIVAFCMFPVAGKDDRWTEYLDRIGRELGIELSVTRHCTRVSVALSAGCDADVIVIAFAVPRVALVPSLSKIAEEEAPS
jgi:hypothetical protein